MKLYLIAPKNPESFWTFDRILPSLSKRCVFPNLALPTVAQMASYTVMQFADSLQLDHSARGSRVAMSFRCRPRLGVA